MDNVLITDRLRILDACKECPIKLNVLQSSNLTCENLYKIKPRYVFFPHYSHKIPYEIFSEFECIGFHMTDLPFGRGGHPLQNLITRQIYQTKISAFKVTEHMDAGPIYLKCDLSLEGKASEIYYRVAKIIITEMIPKIVMNNITPKEQKGEVVCFRRRSLEDNSISDFFDVRSIFDYIRMLDADGYPPAFLETSALTVEFSNAILEGDHVIADAIIRIKQNV